MKLIILLSTLLVIQADASQGDVIIFNGVPYRKELLYKNLSWPGKLDVDFGTNTLYFNNGLKVVSVDLNTKALKDVTFEKGTPTSLKVTSQTVDQVTRDVYIGTTNGIYKYNKNSEAKFVGAKDVMIWRTYFKGVLYFIDYSSRYIYKLIQGQSSRFDALGSVDEFLIDADDVMFFTNDTGFYSQTGGRKNSVNFDIDIDVIQLSIDRNGKVYFCSDDGIYEVVKHNASVKKVVSISMPSAIAFDRDNHIIYSDYTNIYRLLP